MNLIDCFNLGRPLVPRDNTHFEAGQVTAVWDSPGPWALPRGMERRRAVAAWRILWRWVAEWLSAFSERRARSSQVTAIMRACASMEIQVLNRIKCF